MTKATAVLTVVAPYADVYYGDFEVAKPSRKRTAEIAQRLELLTQVDGDDQTQVLVDTCRHIAKACIKADSASALLEADTPHLNLLTAALDCLGVYVFTPRYEKLDDQKLSATIQAECDGDEDYDGPWLLAELAAPKLPKTKGFKREVETLLQAF